MNVAVIHNASFIKGIDCWYWYCRGSLLRHKWTKKFFEQFTQHRCHSNKSERFDPWVFVSWTTHRSKCPDILCDIYVAWIAQKTFFIDCWFNKPNPNCIALMCEWMVKSCSVEGSPVHSGAEHTVRDLKNDLTWTTPLSGKYTSVLLITCKN